MIEAFEAPGRCWAELIRFLKKMAVAGRESGERWRVVHALVKLCLQACDVNPYHMMIITNLECLLSCAAWASTDLSCTPLVLPVALFTRSSLVSLARCMESLCQPAAPHRPRVYSSHLPGRQKGPQNFLSACTRAGFALAGGDWAAFSALCSLLSDAAAATAAPGVSQPSFGPLTSCFSCSAPVYFVLLFLKLQVRFCFRSWGGKDNYQNSFSLKVQPGTKSTFATPSLAVVFSPLITFFSSYLQCQETKPFPRNSFLHFAEFYCAVITSF